jgi:uracil-DNA glycosylase
MKKPGEVGEPTDFAELVEQVQACTVCAASLPHSPRPVLRVSPTARLLIVGQAPGRRVHETGIPWNDPSGDRLRDWLDMTRDAFYDVARIAIVPAGLCYPGTVKGSDLAPRPECAPLWHPPLRAAMPDIRLTLLIGAYAQAYYLGKRPWPHARRHGGGLARFCPRVFPAAAPQPAQSLMVEAQSLVRAGRAADPARTGWRRAGCRR